MMGKEEIRHTLTVFDTEQFWRNLYICTVHTLQSICSPYSTAGCTSQPDLQPHPACPLVYMLFKEYFERSLDISCTDVRSIDVQDMYVCPPGRSKHPVSYSSALYWGMYCMYSGTAACPTYPHRD